MGKDSEQINELIDGFIAGKPAIEDKYVKRKEKPVSKPAPKKTNPNKGGRPKGSGTRFTIKLGDQICDLIANGASTTETASILGIAPSTIFKWAKWDDSKINGLDKFREKYARAREIHYHVHYDLMQDIVDKIDPDLDPIAKAKLQVDVIKFRVTRNSEHNKFRKTIEHKHTGDKDNPVEIKSEVSLPDDDEMKKALLQLLLDQKDEPEDTDDDIVEDDSEDKE